MSQTYSMEENMENNMMYCKPSKLLILLVPGYNFSVLILKVDNSEFIKMLKVTNYF